MLSTSFCSKTLIKENISRYWVLSLLGLFGLFMIGMLPILMSYRRFETVAVYARDVMSGASFVITVLIIALTVGVSSWVFGYLHDPVSTGALHSMPVTRKSLYGSAVISGWVLVMIPIVIFAFMTLVLGGAESSGDPVIYSVNEGIGDNLSAKDIYTLPHILGFIFKSAVTATFVFAVSCIAAVLSGSKNIHPLLALFLIVLPNDLALQIESLCNGYLFGFSGLNINYSLLGPVAQVLNNDEFALNMGYSIYYIILSILLFALAACVYGKVKLERVGNATTFPVVGDVLAALLTLILTIGFSHILASLTATGEADKPARFIVASIISSIIFYMLMRMIADSSPAVLNAANFKKYGVCLAILAVILAFTALDITGYGGRAPEASDVASVHIESEFPSSVFKVDKDFSDPASIETALDLQKAIIEDRKTAGPDDGNTDTISLTWKMKSGREVKRTYMAHKSEEYKETNAALEKLYKLPEYRAELRFDVDKMAEMSSVIEIYGSGAIQVNGNDDGYAAIKREDFKGLLEAVNKDLTNGATNGSYRDLDVYTGGDWEDDNIDTFSVDITYRKPADDLASGKFLTMSNKDKNTLEFLREHGYIK